MVSFSLQFDNPSPLLEKISNKKLNLSKNSKYLLPYSLPLRGIYFPQHSSYLEFKSNPIPLLPPTYFISIWLKVEERDQIFSINSFNTFNLTFKTWPIATFSLFLDNIEVILESNNDTLKETKWNHILFGIIYNSIHAGKFIVNNEKIFTYLLPLKPYKDSIDSVLRIGNEDSEMFVGFIYSFSIFTSEPLFENIFMSYHNCSLAPLYLGSCLSECSANEFLDSDNCKRCNQSCKFGCLDSDNCVSCLNETCEICNNIKPSICYLCKNPFITYEGKCYYCKNSEYFNSNSKACELCPCQGDCKDKCTKPNNTTCTDINCKNCLIQDSDICEKCKDNYLIDKGTCLSCKNLNSSQSCLNCKNICSECGNIDLCKECTNKKLGEEACFCKQGLKNHKGICIQSYFDVNLKLNQYNQLFFEFSENLLVDLLASDFILTLSNVSLSKRIFKLNQSSYKVLINLPSSKSDSNLIIVFTHEIKSISYSILINKTHSFTLFVNNEMYLDSKIKDMKKFTSTGNSIVVGLTLSISFFSFDFSSFFNFLNVVELLSFIFLFELEIPIEIKELLINLRVQKSVPNGLERFIKDNKNRKIEKIFAAYGYGYSIFILNSGNTLITLASVSFLVLVHTAF